MAFLHLKWNESLMLGDYFVLTKGRGPDIDNCMLLVFMLQLVFVFIQRHDDFSEARICNGSPPKSLQRCALQAHFAAVRFCY